MPDINLDFSRPFYLIKVLDKNSGELKFIWSPNIFMEGERPGDDSTIAPKTFIEDIEVKANFQPPINTGEVKISHSVGYVPNIILKDLLKIYLGYYSLDNPSSAVYSLAYTGKIDLIKASLNHTIVRGRSNVKKITDFRRELALSRPMTITELIQKLAIDDGGLESAPDGITDTDISKQKGFAISKNLSIYEHIKKLSDYAGFDVYMDPFDKFNARAWSPEQSSGNDGSAIPWLDTRNDSESDVANQIMYKVYFGVNTVDMELDIKGKKIKDIEIITLADSEGDEIFSIEPPAGKPTGGGNGGEGSDETIDTEVKKLVLSRVTKEDAEKIADAMMAHENYGVSGSLTLVGAPQVRLGDGVNILGYIYGKKPFTRINVQSSDYDASFTGGGEGEAEGEESGGSGGAEETLFKVTGVKHVFNDKLGFITKLNVIEAVPLSMAEVAAAEVEEEEEVEEEGIQVTQLSWNQEFARRGDRVHLTAEVDSVPNRTRAVIEIYEYDADGSHDLILKKPISIVDNRVDTTWDYEYTEDTDEIPTEEESERGYNPPEYFFVVDIDGDRFGEEQESGILQFKDFIEIELKNQKGEPIPNEKYVLTLPDGTTREGELDEHGKAIERDVPPGKCTVEFVDL